MPLAAYPAGVLSDKVDRLLVLFVGLAPPHRRRSRARPLVLPLGGDGAASFFWGLHMGFTQGLLATLVADAAPPELRGTAFGMFNLLGGLALLAASIIAGALWDGAGPEGTFLARRHLRRTRPGGTARHAPQAPQGARRTGRQGRAADLTAEARMNRNKRGSIEAMVDLSLDRDRQRPRRHGALLVLRRRRPAVGETFPWGTLIVNVIGSFMIGFFATITGPDGRCSSPRSARQFVMIGICGGYTTFSSFSLQTLNLANDGEFLYAGATSSALVVLCLIAVWAR